MQVQQLLLKGGGFRRCFWVLPEHRGGIGTGIKDREGPKVSIHVAVEVGNIGKEKKGMGTYKTLHKSRDSDGSCPSTVCIGSYRLPVWVWRVLILLVS